MTNAWFDGTKYTPITPYTLGRETGVNSIASAIVNGFDAAYSAVSSISVAGGIQIPYTFSTTITDSDPGAGFLRLDSATQNVSTVIRVDLAGSDSIDRSQQLTQFAISTSAVKGLLRLAKVSDPTKYLLFEVTAMASPAGYRNVTVKCVDYSSANPFLNNDAIMLYFSRNGDVSAAPINFARVTVASAATTADIWTPLGNQIDWTGAVTCTGFPAAPQAGVERVLICAGAAPFTAGANMLFDGVASGNTVTCAANDIVIVRAVSTTQFRLSRVRYDGLAQVGGAWVLLSTVTASSSATVDVETGFGSTYDDYIIIADGVRPATDTAVLSCQFKLAGAYVSTATYHYHLNGVGTAGTTYSAVASDAETGIRLSPGLDNVNAASNMCFTMDIQNANTTSLSHGVTWRGLSMDISAGIYEKGEGHGASAATGALSGVRFLMNTGNISVGTFRLYGVAKS